MLSMNVFEAFQAELEKLAIDYRGLAGGVAAGGGIGAALGGTGGALVGGVRGYRQARAQGGSVGQSLWAGTGGALHGGGRGALLGGGAGALAGGLAPKLVGGLTTQSNPLGASARFGQRQLHGVTGWLPKKGDPKSLESIRGGAYGARKSLQEAREGVRDATDAAARDKATRGLTRARTAFKAVEKSQSMGLTSIPGYARSMAKAPWETVRASAADQWHSGGIGAKALLVGFPAVSTVGAIRSQEQPTGPGKGESIGRDLGQTVGGVLGGPLPFVTGGAVSTALGGAGGLVGKGVDRLRGRRSEHAPAPENATGQHVPTERVLTPSAAGQRPEMPV